MARQVVGPWVRQTKGCWYATVGGKGVSLGVRGEGNRREAQAAWHRRMATGGPAPETPRKPTPPPEAEVSVKAVADAFLADAATRCKPESMSVYKSALGRFTKRFGSRPALSVRP